MNLIKYRYVLFSALILVVLTMGLSALHAGALSSPARYGDKIEYTLGEWVNLGDPIYGLEYSLEDFLPVYRVEPDHEKGLMEWIDPTARARYLLPLHGDQGMVDGAIILRRTGSNQFSGAEGIGPSSEIYTSYLESKDRLEEFAEDLGVEISGSRIFRFQGRALILVIDTDEGVYGEVFHPGGPGGVVRWPTDPESIVSLDHLDGKVLDESALREIFSQVVENNWTTFTLVDLIDYLLVPRSSDGF